MELHGFKTLEVRWFAFDKKLLEDVFGVISRENEIRTEKRTDYYLLTGLKDTGIKIREGNHELKVKFKPDVDLEFGKKEYWMKWSHPTEKSIFSLVGKDSLTNWIAVEKVRKSMRFSFLENGNDSIYSSEGVAFELTHLHIPSHDKNFFTLGIEAYSLLDEKLEIYFGKTINKLDNFQAELQQVYTGGYPAWMKYHL